MMMTNKRVGMWAWALTGEEAVTALVVGRARNAGLPVKPELARRHAAMLAKQKKLSARTSNEKLPTVTVWRT